MFRPNIFANRYADSFAAHIKWFDPAGASGRETLVSADNLLKIATQIPDGRVNLSKTDLHAAHRRLCATQVAAILFSLLSRSPLARRLVAPKRLRRWKRKIVKAAS